ncbi:MAG: PAS domain S-box protein [Thiohalomonadaceae bacterium]
MISPDLLQAFIDATPDMIAAQDKTLRYQVINTVFARFLGTTGEAVVGRHAAELFPRAKAAQFESDARKAMESGAHVVRETYLSGQENAGWFRITTMPRKRADGTMGGVLVMLRDITRDRHSEKLLRIQAARYATLLATTQDGFWAIDRRGRLRDVNETYCRMSGYTRAELLRMHIADLDAFEAPEATVRHIQKTISTSFERFETLHRRKDGSIIDVEVSASFWAETGKFLAFVRDITERRRAQQALKAERQRLNAILDALPIYITLRTPDYRIIFANQCFRERFGDPKGGRCHTFLFGSETPCENCRTFEVLASGRPVEWEWPAPDGRQYYVYDFPFMDTDGSTYILEAGLDITSLKQAEGQLRQLNATLEQRVAERTAALAAANDELESFSYSVSHDLRGPLRAINGFSQILADDYGASLDDSGRALLERIQDATVRMNLLIDGLLLLARVSRTEIEPVHVDLSALAREVLMQLEEENSSATVHVTIEPGLTARGDRVLLRLLLKNLLSNAMKFSARSPRPEVRFGRMSRNGREVLFVSDNGVGFDDACLPRLFEPFSRLHAGDGFEGTGIGLATVRRIVQRHGGEVWAEGVTGQGATFLFTLPWDGGRKEETPPTAAAVGNG